MKWEGDPFELAKIAPTSVPFLVHLDYGRGLNKVTNPILITMMDFINPTVDLKVARSNGR